MMELAPAQRRALRAAAHHLKPVVSISQKGLTPSVVAEIDRCLKAHELIKLRLYGVERETRATLLTEICSTVNCAAVQHIGNLLVLWRQNPADPAAPYPAAARPSEAVSAARKQTASLVATGGHRRR